MIFQFWTMIDICFITSLRFDLIYKSHHARAGDTHIESKFRDLKVEWEAFLTGELTPMLPRVIVIGI